MDNEEFITLHRHWLWANTIKGNFVAARDTWPKDSSQVSLIAPGFTYMLIWYGLLFSVLERLKAKKVTIPEIRNEVASIFDLLRDCRNAVFHVQGQYASKKLVGIIMTSGTPEKIWKVHESVGNYLLAEFDKRKLEGGALNSSK